VETSVFKAQDSSVVHGIAHLELPTLVKTPNGGREGSFVGLTDLWLSRSKGITVVLSSNFLCNVAYRPPLN